MCSFPSLITMLYWLPLPPGGPLLRWWSISPHIILLAGSSGREGSIMALGWLLTPGHLRWLTTRGQRLQPPVTKACPPVFYLYMCLLICASRCWLGNPFPSSTLKLAPSYFRRLIFFSVRIVFLRTRRLGWVPNDEKGPCGKLWDKRLPAAAIWLRALF